MHVISSKLRDSPGYSRYKIFQIFFLPNFASQGVQTMAAGAGPAHAVYFGCYEQLKSAGLRVTRPRNISDSLVHIGAGAVATVFHDAVMCPADGEIS